MPAMHVKALAECVAGSSADAGLMPGPNQTCFVVASTFSIRWARVCDAMRFLRSKAVSCDPIWPKVCMASMTTVLPEPVVPLGTR